MEVEIKQWSKGKAKALEELIAATKECDAFQIQTCDLGKTVRNQKQAMAHSSKEHKSVHLMCSMSQIPSRNKRLGC